MRLPGPRLEAEVGRTAHASLVAELAERVTEDRHLVEGIYELTVLALEELARETDPRRASAYYLTAALGILGYAPELRACAGCGNPLPEAAAAFSAAAGGFLCRDCAEPEMIRVSVAALKVLRLMGSGGIDLYRRLRLEPALLDEIEAVLEGQLEYHLDHRLRSLQFLRQMRTTV